jgi:NADPH:quinone reductase-like Zn-dependent oxidoreductase
MRNVAVWLPPDDAPSDSTKLSINNYSFVCGEIKTEIPAFDDQSGSHANSVFVRILGFSCNYRDRSLISLFSRRKAQGRFYIIGSEFVGDVIAVGSNVSALAPGDRVIADNAYIGAGHCGCQGIPTNHSSREFAIFPSEQLFKVSKSMPLAAATSFSVAAQTVYSMLRKARIDRGGRVLLTGGRSNTSLFAISALRRSGSEIIVVTRSAEAKHQLLDAGAHDVVVLKNGHSTSDALSRRVGLVDVVLDPFCDIYLPLVLPCLRGGGRYVTCGLYAQGTDSLTDPDGMAGPRTWHALTVGLINNLEIHLNCLGTTGDLTAAYQDYAACDIDVQLDSVHSGGAVREFLHRTYIADDRWGKVAYLYE